MAIFFPATRLPEVRTPSNLRFSMYEIEGILGNLYGPLLQIKCQLDGETVTVFHGRWSRFNKDLNRVAELRLQCPFFGCVLAVPEIEVPGEIHIHSGMASIPHCAAPHQNSIEAERLEAFEDELAS